MMNELPFSVTDEAPLGNGTSRLVLGNGENSRNFIISTRLLKQYGFEKGRKISDDDMDLLDELEEITKAIKKGLDLLTYSDMPKSALVRKLRIRGFNEDAAHSAASMLEEMGYIDEPAHALRVARGASRQFYGPLAISDKLRSKGFEKKYIRLAMQALEAETDFVENLRIYTEQKGVTEDIFSKTDPKLRQKACASLLRRGFTYEQISQLKAGK